VSKKSIKEEVEMTKLQLREKYKKHLHAVKYWEMEKEKTDDFRSQCVIDLHIKDCKKEMRKMLSIAENKGWMK
jgi:hypothetical protein